MSPATPAHEGEIFLAIDGGGTKTTCTLARVGKNQQYQILGQGKAAASNPRTVGSEEAAAQIVASANRAKCNAKLADIVCDRALLAIAGTLERRFRDELSSRMAVVNLAKQVTVVPDLVPLIVAHDDTAAIGLIAGTGSVAIGQDEQGRMAIAGGWGPLLGDDGSGFAVGKAALRSTQAQLEISGLPTGLSLAICDHLAAWTSSDIKSKLAQADDIRHFVAQLAPIVFAEAQRSVPEAKCIVAQAAADLAELVQRLHQRLDLETRPVPLTVSGGLFQGSNLLSDHLDEALARFGLQAEIQTLVDPTSACLRMLITDRVPADFDFLP